MPLNQSHPTKLTWDEKNKANYKSEPIDVSDLKNALAALKNSSETKKDQPGAKKK